MARVEKRSSLGEELKTFVGGLPIPCEEAELGLFMSQFGQVVDVFISREPHSRLHKGFAFVTFSSVHSLEHLFGEHYFKDRQIEVMRNLHNQLFLSSVTHSISPPAIRTALENQGFGVHEVLIGTDLNGVPRGFATVRLHRDELLPDVVAQETLWVGQIPLGIHSRLPKRPREGRFRKQTDSSSILLEGQSPRHKKSSQHQVPQGRELAAEKQSPTTRTRKLSISLTNSSKEYYPVQLQQESLILEEEENTQQAHSLTETLSSRPVSFPDPEAAGKRLSNFSSYFYSPVVASLRGVTVPPSTVEVRVAYYTFPGRD
jgi:hypothetical protein